MTDLEINAALCLSCKKLINAEKIEANGLVCPVCGCIVHQRKKNSIEKTWAFTLTAILFYIPANILPIMDIEMFSGASSNTILGGVRELLNNKMYFVGIIVFIASFIVPLFKIVTLLYLLITIKIRNRFTRRRKTVLYHIVEIIGKWSMLDVYVITIMAGLVNMGYIIKIKGDMGAVFFGATVVMTMLASKSFDTRLIWDKKGE